MGLAVEVVGNFVVSLRLERHHLTHDEVFLGVDLSVVSSGSRSSDEDSGSSSKSVDAFAGLARAASLHVTSATSN